MRTFGLFAAGVLLGASLATARTVDVSIRDFSFTPDTVVANFGDTVRWTNLGAFNHTTTSGKSDSSPGLIWDSPFLTPGAIYLLPLTFTGADIPYFCRVHPLTMRGRLTSLIGVSEEPGSPRPAPRFELRTMNPDVLLLELPQAAEVSVAVYDAAGVARASIASHALLGSGYHRLSLALPGLGNGVYLLSVHIGSTARTARVVFAR
jgi:plastocyanin